MMLFIFTLIGLGTVYLKIYPEIREGLEMQDAAAKSFLSIYSTNLSYDWEREEGDLLTLTQIDRKISVIQKKLNIIWVGELFFNDKLQQDVKELILKKKRHLTENCVSIAGVTFAGITFGKLRCTSKFTTSD